MFQGPWTLQRQQRRGLATRGAPSRSRADFERRCCPRPAACRRDLTAALSLPSMFPFHHPFPVGQTRRQPASPATALVVAHGRLMSSSAVKPVTLSTRGVGPPPSSVPQLGALCVCLCVLRARSLWHPAACLPSTDPDLPSASLNTTPPHIVAQIVIATTPRLIPPVGASLDTCVASALAATRARRAHSSGDIRPNFNSSLLSERLND